VLYAFINGQGVTSPPGSGKPGKGPVRFLAISGNSDEKNSLQQPDPMLSDDPPPVREWVGPSEPWKGFLREAYGQKGTGRLFPLW